MEARVKEKRDQIIIEQVSRETPWVMLILAALIIFFDSAFALAGFIAPLGYYLSDLIQEFFFLACVVLIRRGITPSRWSPWIFAAAIVVNTIALSYQYVIDDTGTSLGVIVMSMVLIGGLLAMWTPFLIAATLMVAIVSATLLTHNPDFAIPWIVTILTGVGAAAALLFARRRSALDLAIASITIEEFATKDIETGLLNRRGLGEAAVSLSALASRSELPVFAVFLDIIGLKQVNDSYGHAMGDPVIQRVGHAIGASCRDADFAARWGGDEFVVIGIGTPDMLSGFGDRVREQLDLQGVDHAWSGGISVGTSLSSELDIDALIHAADKEMYASRLQ